MNDLKEEIELQLSFFSQQNEENSKNILLEVESLKEKLIVKDTHCLYEHSKPHV